MSLILDMSDMFFFYFLLYFIKFFPSSLIATIPSSTSTPPQSPHCCTWLCLALGFRGNHHRGEVLFSSYHGKVTYHRHDSSLLIDQICGWGSVSRFLHYKVTTPTHTHSNFHLVFFGRKSACIAHLKSGELRFTSLRVEYPHNVVIGILLH